HLPAPPSPPPLSLHDALPISTAPPWGHVRTDWLVINSPMSVRHDAELSWLYRDGPLRSLIAREADPTARHRQSGDPLDHQRGGADRKSTRLNSSHQIISYAVF